MVDFLMTQIGTITLKCSVSLLDFSFFKANQLIFESFIVRLSIRASRNHRSKFKSPFFISYLAQLTRNGNFLHFRPLSRCTKIAFMPQNRPFINRSRVFEIFLNRAFCLGARKKLTCTILAKSLYGDKVQKMLVSCTWRCRKLSIIRSNGDEECVMKI